MRRRLATLLSAALLSMSVLLPGSPALAGDTTVVLAVEGGEGGEAPGLDPMGPENSENEFAPPQYEANWTATLAGRALFALILLIAVLMGIGYYVRVARFSRDTRQS